jgi:SulP family sulfate permease
MSLTSSSTSPDARNVPVWLADGLAALSVVLVLIPQSLAYAELAGMPPYYGLYAAALPPIAAAFFASSIYLQTGPTALTGILTFGALASVFAPASSEFVLAASLLALAVGLWRVAIGMFKLGAIAYFMSQPVLRGFTTAAALLIISSQLPSAVGVSPPSGTVVEELLWTLTRAPSWQPLALLMAGLSAVIIIISKRLSPLLPGVFVAVVVTTALSVFVNYNGPVVGSVDVARVPVTLPWQVMRDLAGETSWTALLGLLPQLLVSGLVIAVVGFAEATSIARAFAAETRSRWNPNQEFISQGVANLASSLVSGFPVGGSFSRSALARTAGAKSRWNGAITGLLVFAALPLMPLLARLPNAVLAAIVIVSVSKLVRFKPMLTLWRLSRPQFVTAWLTFVATLLLSPRLDYAILVGIGASLLIHLYRQMQLEVTSYYEDDILYVVPSGVLWFGSVQRFEDAVDRLLESDVSISSIVIDGRSLGHVDLSGVMAIVDNLQDAEESGISIEIQGLSDRMMRIIEELRLEQQN